MPEERSISGLVIINAQIHFWLNVTVCEKYQLELRAEWATRGEIDLNFREVRVKMSFV